MQITTTLTRIGNSSGVILQKKLLEEAGITEEVIIEAKNGSITIKPAVVRPPVNLDINTWAAQIKKAIKTGNKLEKSMWGDDVSADADKDITWPKIK